MNMLLVKVGYLPATNTLPNRYVITSNTNKREIVSAHRQDFVSLTSAQIAEKLANEYDNCEYLCLSVAYDVKTGSWYCHCFNRKAMDGNTYYQQLQNKPVHDKYHNQNKSGVLYYIAKQIESQSNE